MKILENSKGKGGLNAKRPDKNKKDSQKAKESFSMFPSKIARKLKKVYNYKDSF